MREKKLTTRLIPTALIAFLLFVAGCGNPAPADTPAGTPIPTRKELTSTPTITPTATPSPTATLEPHLAAFLSQPLPDGSIARLGKGEVYDIALSPDGDSVALATSIGVYRYQLEGTTGTPQELWFVPTTVRTTSVAFSPDGHLVAAGSANDSIMHRSDSESPVRNPSLLLVDAESGEPLLASQYGSADDGYYTSSLAFSPDGARLAAAYTLYSGGSKYFFHISAWNLSNGVSSEWDFAYEDEVAFDLNKGFYVPVPPKDLAFSPDGSLLVYRKDLTNEIHVLDAQRGDTIRSLDGSGRDVDYLSFSPDGKLLASGVDDGTVLVWDTEHWTIKRTLTGSGKKNPTPPGSLRYWMGSSALAFSADGEFLATGSFNGVITIWNVSSGARIRTLAGHTGPITDLAFTPQDGGLRSVTLDGTILLHNLSDGETMQTHTLNGYGVFRRPVFSADGVSLFSASDHGAAVWDVAGREIWFDVAGGLAAFSPQNGRIAVETEDHTIELWDASLREKTFTLSGHTRDVTAMAFSPDGKRLASGSDDRTVILWDTENGEKLYVFQGYSFPIDKVVFSPDGKTLVANGTYNAVVFWDTDTGEKQAQFIDYQMTPEVGAFSPDGKILACVDYRFNDYTLLLLDTATGELVFSTKTRNWSGGDVVFSPDGSMLVLGDSPLTMEFIEINGPSDFHPPEENLNGHTVSFSADGSLGAGADYQNVVVWDVADGMVIRRFAGHTWMVGDTFFSPDGSMLASDSLDGTIILWDLSV